MLNIKSCLLHSMTALLAVGVLSACHNDDNTSVVNNAQPGSFKVRITNLTANQPLSPAAVIMHRSGYHAFSPGDAASTALEKMAEGGDNTDLLSAVRADDTHLNSASGGQPLGPGASMTMTIPVSDITDAHLSLLGMLVNTNDAFAGLESADLSQMAINEVMQLDVVAWDSGTERNNEAAGTIPGPADQGEGYNPARNDIANIVAIHRGVVSQDDGLSSSVLNESHRFDNPVLQVTISRTE